MDIIKKTENSNLCKGGWSCHACRPTKDQKIIIRRKVRRNDKMMIKEKIINGSIYNLS